MKVNFFETSMGLDQRAVGGGVYHVELLKEGHDKSLSLYIGESVWVIERCGRHLYAFFENPNYFGLTSEDLNQNDLTLKFSLLEGFEDKKSVLGSGSYKEAELKFIKEEKPLTQLRTSDRQISDIGEKVKKVQEQMAIYKFKE